MSTHATIYYWNKRRIHFHLYEEMLEQVVGIELNIGIWFCLDVTICTMAFWNRLKKWL